jgi:hypothetical protein
MPPRTRRPSKKQISYQTDVSMAVDAARRQRLDAVLEQLTVAEIGLARVEATEAAIDTFPKSAHVEVLRSGEAHAETCRSSQAAGERSLASLHKKLPELTDADVADKRYTLLKAWLGSIEQQHAVAQATLEDFEEEVSGSEDDDGDIAMMRDTLSANLAHLTVAHGVATTLLGQ